MRALSASISLTDIVICVPFDCPRTGFGGASTGSSGFGSWAASGILLSSAAMRFGVEVLLAVGLLGSVWASACRAWLRPFSAARASVRGASVCPRRMARASSPLRVLAAARTAGRRRRRRRGDGFRLRRLLLRRERRLVLGVHRAGLDLGDFGRRQHVNRDFDERRRVHLRLRPRRDRQQQDGYVQCRLR